MDLTPTTEENGLVAGFESNLSEQSNFNNMVKEALNAFIRNIGWFTLELLLYQGAGLAVLS